MKIFVISLVVFLLYSYSEKKPQKAYLCNGSMSTKYHLRPDCEGLQRCTTRLDTLTIEQAKAKGRTLCGFEKKR